MNWLWGGDKKQAGEGEAGSEHEEAERAVAAVTGELAEGHVARQQQQQLEQGQPQKGHLLSLFSSLGTRIVEAKNKVKAQLEEFTAEEKKAMAEKEARQEGADPPWVILSDKYKDREPLLKEQILNLSQEMWNFLKGPPESQLTGFDFDLEAHALVAQACLREDKALEQLRWVLVPWKVKEPMFWRNYFAHIFVIKRAILLQSVDETVLQASRERMRALEQGQDPHQAEAEVSESGQLRRKDSPDPSASSSPVSSASGKEESATSEPPPAQEHTAQPQQQQQAESQVGEDDLLAQLDLSGLGLDGEQGQADPGAPDLSSMSALELEMASVLGDADPADMDMAGLDSSSLQDEIAAVLAEGGDY